jgi:putative protease
MAIKKTTKAKAKKPTKKAAPKKAKEAVKAKKLVKAKAKIKVSKPKKPAKEKKVPARKKPAVKAAKRAAKKPVAATASKPAPRIIEDRMIGWVTHYFDHIEVGVIELTEDLAVGEMIRIVGGEDTDFKQIVESMELDHEKIDKAGKGKEVGLQLKKKAREGYKVYRIKA